MSNFKNFLNNFLNNNGVLKLIAFLIAFIFWFIVVGIESPEIEKEYRNIPVTVSLAGTVADENNLMLTKTINVSVNVTLKGERSAIANFSREDIRAYVDFSAVTVAGTYNLPVIIDYDNSALTIVKTSLSEISNVTIDNKVSQSVDINVITNGSVADGYILDSVNTYPTSLLVTGPESIVSTIVSSSVSLDISGINNTAVKNLPFTLFDSNGNTVSSPFLSFDTDKIMVTANVYKTKEVSLSYEVYNSSGGNDASFITKIISPQTILISGTEEALSRINSVDLGSVDAANLADSGFAEDIKFTLPNGIKTVDGTTEANVSVYYDNIETREYKVSISADNIIAPDGRTVTTKTKSITVKIRGRASALDTLTLEEINPVIDVSDQTVKGSISVAVRFDLPENLQIGVKGEYKISVTIK